MRETCARLDSTSGAGERESRRERRTKGEARPVQRGQRRGAQVLRDSVGAESRVHGVRDHSTVGESQTAAEAPARVMVAQVTQPRHVLDSDDSHEDRGRCAP